MTEANRQRLRGILKQVKKSVFSTICDQLFYGVTSLSVPVLNLSGKTVAALNTSAYTGQTSEQDLIDIRLAEMRASAMRLGQVLERHPLLLKSLQTAREGKTPSV